MRLLLPVLLLWGISALAEDLMPEGGFESPAVSERTPQKEGGDPCASPGKPWIGFDAPQKGDAGTIVGGLTNEAHHGGGQALFIQFDHVARSYVAASLTSNFIPVAAGASYEVGLWGEIDPQEPLTGQGRSAYLKLQVDYFAKDTTDSVGETVYAVQPLAGGKDRPSFFTADGWRYFSKNVTTPPDAVFAQITWRWETGSNPGETTGVMFFDDATFMERPAAGLRLKPHSKSGVDESSSPRGSGTAPARSGTSAVQ